MNPLNGWTLLKGFVNNSIVDVLSRYLDENETDLDMRIRIADIILTK